MNETLTVELPSDLLASAKVKAAAEGRSVTSLIEDGLRSVVAERVPVKEANGGQSVVLPVSQATGGFLPGIDLNKMSNYYEMEDAEYIERMQRMT